MKPSLPVFSEAANVTAPDAYLQGPEVADGPGSLTLEGGARRGRAGGAGRAARP